MPELRKDLIRDNWVVIVTERSVKPTDLPVAKVAKSFAAQGGFCPFCEGNESLTPPEILALRPKNSEKDGPGWSVRLIPNKFSAFSLSSQPNTVDYGVFSQRSDFGTHEVVIEDPRHGVEFHDQTEEKIGAIFKLIKERYCQLASDPRIKYIQVYKNSGIFAGASLSHGHMQIVALPFVPRELEGMAKYNSRYGKCLICETLEQERRDGSRIVFETGHFVILCPYASRFPGETWIVPKEHLPSLQYLDDSSLTDLAKSSLWVTKAINRLLDGPSYNMVFNCAPVNVSDNNEGYHWFLEIFPRLIVQAGVEIATGLYMNPVAPEWIAESLKKVFEDDPV